MDIGVFMFATDYAIRVDELAPELESRGFESLWLPEHTHIPASRRTPFPGGGDLPREYWHTHDPFVALATAAATTRNLKVATGICLIIERDPIVTAKEVASLDALSNGRFLFGIGGGWNAEEMENHGTDYKTRFKKLEEQILAMKKIWTEEEPEFHGEFVSFDPIWCFPKPVTSPHPPVILGGGTKYTRQRVVDFCDGWLPIPSRGGDLLAGIRDLEERAEKAGRDRSSISVSVFGARPDRGSLDEYSEGGVQRAILRLPSEGRDKVLPLLDEYAALLS